MLHHHEKAIEHYLARHAGRPDVLGILLTGSLASGTGRADSDVDLVLVVTEEAWSRAVEAERIMFVDDEGAGYDGGYFDVKLATLGQLEAAVDRADAPARHSLGGARVLFDQGFDLAALLPRISAGASNDRSDVVGSFVAQARIHGDYFLAHGLAHDDAFLTAHAAVHLSLAAGRALLADAGAHHPGPKDLVATLRAVPDPGPRFADAIVDLVRSPSTSAARVLLDLVEERFGATLQEGATLSRFVLDNELAWFTRVTPPEYR